MTTSRRNLIQALAAGGAAIATAQRRHGPGATAQTAPHGSSGQALAQYRSAGRTAVDLGDASTQERAATRSSISSRLEDDARKIISPGRFAVMGPSGDGWTYRENRARV